MRAGRRGFLVLLLTIGTLLSLTAVAGAAPRYQRYVALGDSYTAGPLIPWQAASWCFRSNNNYPSLLAAKLGTDAFTDVSGSSADTTNMTQPQTVPSPSLALGTAPPQLDALSLDTDLVTVGIGGNDAGVFGALVGTCPALRDGDPTGAPCKAHFTVGGVDTMRAAIAQTERNLEGVLAAVHARAPGATVLVVGYPRIAPATGYCQDQLPFADGDYRWADGVESALNAAEAHAATAPRATYVDTYRPSLGHDICAGRAAWVNGKNLNLFAAAPYHPLASGMAAEANIAYNVLTGRGDSAADTAPVAPRAAPAQRTAAADPASRATVLRSLGALH